MIEIVDCIDQSAVAWDDYLLDAPGASFYHLFGWREINRACFGHRSHYLAALRQGRPCGVFPMVFVESRIFGRLLVSMPFVNYGGIVAGDEEARTALLQRAIELSRKERADYLEIRSLTALEGPLQTSTKKISMTLDLDPDPDVIWNRFQSKHRTNIRRAYKDAFEVKFGREELLDDFYRVMANSWRSLGTPIYRKSYFRQVLRTFPDQALIFVAYQDNSPVAVAFNGYYRATAEGMWAGTLPEYRRANPNYVLYWEMIKHACLHGCRQYHLGRSTADSGAETFKKKWNAVPHQLYWQYHLADGRPMPALNVDNPRYQLAIRLWRRMPVGLTTLGGPFLARGIP